MSLINTKYLRVVNSDSIGDLSVIWTLTQEQPLVPVLKVQLVQKEKNQNIFNLTPGFLDLEEIFHPCPLNVSYVQILKLEQIEYYTFTCQVKSRLHCLLFSKDYKLSRSVCIELPLDLIGLIKVINMLNLYVLQGNDLSDLILENINTDNLRIRDNKILIEHLNKLEISLFVNSEYNTRKWDTFWKEAEIRNIPKDKYILDLIKTG